MGGLEHDDARELRDLSIELIAQLDRAVDSAQEQLAEPEIDAYRRAAGWVMGEIAAAVLRPLFTSHPDLQPDYEDWGRIASRRVGTHAGRQSGSVAAALAPKLHRMRHILGRDGGFAVDEAVRKLDEMDGFVAA